jgi:hypothetical protein
VKVKVKVGSERPGGVYCTSVPVGWFMILLGDILLKYLSCLLLRIGTDAYYIQVKEPIIAVRAVSRSLHSIRELEYNQRMVKLIADPS